MADNRYETEDGEPRFGARLSPEELEAYLREQGIEPPASRSGADAGGRSPASGRSGSRPTEPGPSQPSWRAGAGDADPYAPGAAGPRPGWAPGPSSVPRVPPGSSAPWAATGAAPPRRGRWRLLVLGLVLLIVVPGALTVGATVYVVGGGLAGAVPLGPNGTVYLEADTSSMIYSSGMGDSTADCTVTDPAGASVDVVPSTELGYGAFTSSDAGTYTVSCPGGTSGLIVGPAMDESRLGVAGLVVVAAMGTGVAGLVLSVLGLVRAVSPARRR